MARLQTELFTEDNYQYQQQQGMRKEINKPKTEKIFSGASCYCPHQRPEPWPWILRSSPSPFPGTFFSAPFLRGHFFRVFFSSSFFITFSPALPAPQQLPFFSSFLSINIIVISMFAIVPGARPLWSLPHICVVYLPRKVLIFDYFLISLPHTHFLFSFRDTSVTLNLVPKVTNSISQVPPWLLALGSSGHLPWHKLQPSHGDYQAKKKVKRGSQNIWWPLLSIARGSVQQHRLLRTIVRKNSLKEKHYHSAIAAALHVGEAVQAFFLASLQYNLNPFVVLLWTLNVFFFGIFGFWPLAFPQVTKLTIKDSRLKKDSIWNSGILCNDWCMKNLSGESKFFLQVFQDNKATYCSLPGSLCFNTDLQWKLNRSMFWQRHMVNLSSWGLIVKVWIPSSRARCESFSHTR